MLGDVVIEQSGNPPLPAAGQVLEEVGTSVSGAQDQNRLLHGGVPGRM